MTSPKNISSAETALDTDIDADIDPSWGAIETARSTSLVMGIVFVLLSAVSFSLAGLFIKMVPWSALSINAGRCLFAFAVIYGFMRSQGRRFVINRAVILGGLLNFTMTQTFAFANKLTTAANAIVLQFTEPVFAILIMWLIFSTRPNRKAILTCIAVMAGIACFFFDELSAAGTLGNTLAIISGAAYAGVFFIKKIPGCCFESSTLLSFIACIVVGAPSLIADASATLSGALAIDATAVGVSLGTGAFGSETILISGPFAGFAISPFIVIAIMGVVQTGASYIFLSKGLDIVPPVTASLVSTIEPILNPIIVALVLGEIIGPLSLVGAVLVIGSATAYTVSTGSSDTTS